MSRLLSGADDVAVEFCRRTEPTLLRQRSTFPDLANEMPVIDEHQVKSIAEGVDHCEGVAYGLDGFIYAGGSGGQIYRVSLETSQFEQISRQDGWILGLALDNGNNVYGCDLKNRAVVRIRPDGSAETYSSGSKEQEFVLPNYCVFDRKGNLYVSDSGHWEQPSGRVFKIDAQGKTQLWHSGPFSFANGLALDRDEKSLYLVESARPGVVKINIDENGAALDTEVVVELPRTVPDGLAFDAQGYLWISLYRPDALYRLSPERRLEVFVEDWRGMLLCSPTNLAFCGPELDIIVTSSLGHNRLYRLDVGIKGQALNYPKL